MGALIGWNMPEERVKQYETGFKQRGILMGVRTPSDDAQHLEQNWRDANGALQRCQAVAFAVAVAVRAPEFARA